MAFDDKATYYDAGGIETIEILKAKLTPDQFKGWLLGNLIKYSCRANHKGTFDRDVEKVAFYSGLLKSLDAETLGKSTTVPPVPAVPRGVKDHCRLPLCEHFDVKIDSFCGVGMVGEPQWGTEHCANYSAKSEEKDPTVCYNTVCNMYNLSQHNRCSDFTDVERCGNYVLAAKP